MAEGESPPMLVDDHPTFTVPQQDIGYHILGRASVSLCCTHHLVTTSSSPAKLHRTHASISPTRSRFMFGSKILGSSASTTVEKGYYLGCYNADTGH